MPQNFSVMEKYLGVRYSYREEKQKKKAEESFSIVTAAMIADLSADRREKLTRADWRLQRQKMVGEYRFGNIPELLNAATD